MNLDSIPTPELDKMRAVKDKSQSQGEFLDWLQSEKGLTLCSPNEHDEYCPSYISIEKLLAEFHGIDLNKMERERRDILDAMSKQPVS